MTENPSKLVAALVKARAELPTIVKDSINPHFRNKFASLDGMIAAMQPVWSANGLACLQPVVGYEVHTIILHASGESLVLGRYPIPEGLDSQKQGSAVTYARRYSLAAVWGVAAEEDDDAEAATGRPQKAPASPQDATSTDPKAHHTPERRKATAALFAGLEKAFGDSPPWEGAKARVLKEVFGTSNMKSLAKMPNDEFLQLYSDNYAAVLEAAVKATKEPENPEDLPF